MEKINAILVTIIGVLLVIPLLGVTALGSLTTGIIGWVVAIVILAIGVIGLMGESA
ncbi:MAG: hypothetical protein ABIF18_02385 [archaeon]